MPGTLPLLWDGPHVLVVTSQMEMAVARGWPSEVDLGLSPLCP